MKTKRHHRKPARSKPGYVEDAAPPEGDATQPPFVIRPELPEWHAAEPGFIKRSLMKLAGVDLALACECPADEQHQMARVGLSMLFGSMVLVILVAGAMVIILGTDPTALVINAAVTFAVTGVVFCFDSKLIAADWIEQGAAYARAHGIKCAGGSGVKRLGTIACRWLMSFFIAWTLAVFALLAIFDPDINRRWLEEHQRVNRDLITAVTGRYDTLVNDLASRTEAVDSALKVLEDDRARVVATVPSARDIDRQVSDLLERIASLESDRAEAEQRHAFHKENMTAELRGVQLHPGNTGAEGKGVWFYTHEALAEQQRQIADGHADAIEIAKAEIASLRAQRAEILGTADARTQARLAGIDREIDEATARRANLTAELRGMANDRQAWIDVQVKASVNHVPMKQGLLDRLGTLWQMIQITPGMAAFVVMLKVVLILLESAGPLAKVAFTRAKIYSLRAALRAEDFAEIEADRRHSWHGWHSIRQERRASIVVPRSTDPELMKIRRDREVEEERIKALDARKARFRKEEVLRQFYDRQHGQTQRRAS